MHNEDQFVTWLASSFIRWVIGIHLMDKGTGLAVIALLITTSSVVVTYFEYVPRLTTLNTHIDALQRQLDDIQDQQSTITVLTVPFSHTLIGHDGAVYVRELIPRPSEPFIARSIMVTVAYQIIQYDMANVLRVMINPDPAIENPCSGRT